MFITFFPSSSLSLLGLFLASFIDAQRTVTRDACAIARSVDNSCTARFSIDRAKTGLDTTWTAPPVITYDGVDVVRCFCCLEEAPLTPVWSSCAAQIETASPEKDRESSCFFLACSTVKLMQKTCRVPPKPPRLSRFRGVPGRDCDSSSLSQHERLGHGMLFACQAGDHVIK